MEIVKSYGRIEYDDKFNELWFLYPKRDGKKRTYGRYLNMLKEYTHEEILKAVELYRDSVNGKELKYIKCCDIFFHDRIYDYLNVEEVKNENEIFEFDSESDKTNIEEIETIDNEYNIYINKLRNMNYKNYLESEHWKHYKEQAIKNAHYKCQLCNKDHTLLNVHHNNYENRGRETFLDTIVLCSECHSKFHNKE